MKTTRSYIFETSPLQAERWEVDASELSASQHSLAHKQLDSARIELEPSDKLTLTNLGFFFRQQLPLVVDQAARLVKPLLPKPYDLFFPVEVESPSTFPARRLEARGDSQRNVYLHDPLAPRTAKPLQLDALSAWSLSETSKWDLNFECTAWKGAKTGMPMLTFGYADVTQLDSHNFSSANKASRKFTAQLLNSVSEVIDEVLSVQTFKERAHPSIAIEKSLRLDWLFQLQKARDLIWGHEHSTARAAANLSVMCWTPHELFIVSCGAHNVAILTAQTFRLLHIPMQGPASADAPLESGKTETAVFKDVALSRQEIANDTLLAANFEISTMLKSIKQEQPGLEFNAVQSVTDAIQRRLATTGTTHAIFSFIQLDSRGGLSC